MYKAGDTEPDFECSAAFFLKITSIMKYYIPNIADYSLVLQDIGNRFLSNEWNSYQWLSATNSITTYVVTHDYAHNSQTRLEETLGAWQALLGAFENFNSTYDSNMEDMLLGNTTKNIQPAWSLFMGSAAGLFVSSSDMFAPDGPGATQSAATTDATAQAEIVMFLMGIVPQTTTIAFPLEELGYEYIFDVNPVLMSFNWAARQITIPVVHAGMMTFQYGQSPVTYTFNQSGVYTISFTSSWNMISGVEYGQGVSVIGVSCSKTVVGQDYSLNVTVTAAGLGSYPETFNVTAYANTISIASQNVTLPSGSSTDITFVWNTTGFAYDNYTISACAWPVLGGTNTSNSNFTGGNVVVTIPGDVDGNGIVNMGDIVSILLAFGSTLRQPNYNPNCDIECNGKVDMGDVVIALLHFGQHYS
jgi:hypothetical protein